MQKRVRWYVYGLLIALDQLVNAALGGYPDETISFRSAQARNEGKRWGCVLCKVLDAIHERHCDYALRSKLASVMRRML